MSRVTLKDHIREGRLFTTRAVMALVVTILLSLTILGRLVYLQVVEYDHYATLSHDNRVNILPLPPTRGLIYDRNGVLLAQNIPTFNLEVIPELVKNIDETIVQLQELIEITDDDIKRFHKLRKQKPGFESLPLRFRLNDEEVARFAVNRYRFPGIDIAARLVRNYPLKERAVHAIGYVGRINEEELQRVDAVDYRGTSHIGKIGIEKSYEDILHGTVGVRQVEINANGRILNVLQETAPIPGQDIILTIDSELQAASEEALAGQRGAVVAIEPTTGDVLALASTPSYDPNLFVIGIDQKTYSDLQSSLDEPLFNRAIRGRYPPGSTIKPFMGLAGLEYGKVNAETSVYCPGWYSLRGDTHRYRDWKRVGHGRIKLHDAIAESCDVFFYDLSLTLGIDLMHTFLSQFGFGSLTGIDITSELPGLLPSRQWKQANIGEQWYPGETLIAGIGQGYNLTTPLQLANATATLANRGLTMQPRTVKAIQGADTQTVEELTPTATAKVYLADANNWDQIIASMVEVVHGKRGTARKIGQDAPYIIAGKTGTAQVFGVKQDERYIEEEIELRLRDHALFIAFAPAEDPKIALAVIVENGGSGSGTAAPIARRILDQYLLNDSTPSDAG